MKIFILFALLVGSHCLPTDTRDDDEGFDHPHERPPIKEPKEPEDDRSIFHAANRVLKRATDRSAELYCPDDGTEVTMTAKFWYVNDFTGGQENADAIADLFVATTNEVLSNSKVSIKYQKWGTVQQHPMTNDELSRAALGLDVTSNELFIDSVGTTLEDYEFLRQTADHVVLLYNTLSTEPNRCYGMSHDDNAYTTFWTIIVTGTEDNDLTFAHEAGHCMGAMHNREQSEHDADAINYGYCMPGTTYASVMAYTETCPDGQNERIPYYSNPDVSYEGNPTGSDTANNALNMNDKKYSYSNAGTNCADGTATDKTAVTNQCEWGDDWTEQPPSKCCCEDNLYDGWESYRSSPSCYLYVPGFDYSWMNQGYARGMKFKDCKNLLGEMISPYKTCTDGAPYDWVEYLDIECDCDAPCGGDETTDTDEDVDGGWSDFGECSATCGGGTQERTCTNPSPSGNGADCEGDASQACGEDDCPNICYCEVENGASPDNGIMCGTDGSYEKNYWCSTDEICTGTTDPGTNAVSEDDRAQLCSNEEELTHACGTDGEQGVLEITGLSAGTSVTFKFVTYTDDSYTTEGYKNMGLWITDGPSSYGNWGSDHEGKLVYTRGSKEGTATVSTTGDGIYAYVYPYTSSGSWCLDLTVVE